MPTAANNMDVAEKMRRWKRSLDGFISFRKAVILALGIFVFILYIGPSFLSWLFGDSGRGHAAFTSSCVDDKLITYERDILRLDAHAVHSPWREGRDRRFLPYVGNGYVGVATESLSVAPRDAEEDPTGRLHIFGGHRHLSLPVPLNPLVRLEATSSSSEEGESGTVVHYTKGMVHSVRCGDFGGGGGGGGEAGKVSISSQFYAHRAIPSVLVQEFKVTNPTQETVQFSVERLGILEWKDAVTKPKTLEHGDGNQKYIIVSGLVPLLSDPAQAKMVVVMMKRLPTYLEVEARMSQTLSVITAVAYSRDPFPTSKPGNLDARREKLEQEVVDAMLKAVSMTQLSLKQLHQDIWRELWTTGFGISHSMADGAVNGNQINATMYYVLSQTAAPMHFAHASEKEKAESTAQLAYSEGCYGGHPTLQATTLWRNFYTLDEINSAVSSWMVTLEKNGCSKLLRAGADGVAQAMVLSFASLKFREEHLELNSHPKDLHRDYFIRRVSYGNATHLNISIVVHDDNKPYMLVALDRRNKDYFACDAGCLDPPVKLSTDPKVFPVKMTDPMTAILYITSDHQHMEELKLAIHFKEVAEAPAHEHHVLAMHRHGNKLGGLPALFWFSIGFLIFVFHLFLFKLIWQEYCAANAPGQDKFRSRKFSDYQ